MSTRRVIVETPDLRIPSDVPLNRVTLLFCEAAGYCDLGLRRTMYPTSRLPSLSCPWLWSRTWDGTMRFQDQVFVDGT
jgi:hypothetical protein